MENAIKFALWFHNKKWDTCSWDKNKFMIQETQQVEDSIEKIYSIFENEQKQIETHAHEPKVSEYYVPFLIQLFNDKFENVLPKIKFDVIITDPPYPDYMADEYGYYEGIIEWCKNFDCRQLIFWSAKVDFPLDYTAKHIWDKKCGVGSMYEVIYERNGGKAYKVYNNYLINSTVAASYAKDVFYNHPNQKPIQLMRKLILENTKKGDIIFDPFMGSGTTAEACAKEKRGFIGCEMNKQYFDIAQKRIKLYERAPSLF